MAPAVNTDQRYHFRVDLLQGHAMPYRDKPVLGAMDDVGMAFYFGQPEICAQVET